MEINRTDWKSERIGASLFVGGISLQRAKETTELFLSWYYDWLIEHEPKATASHSEINDILGLLQGDLNEVLRTE